MTKTIRKTLVDILSGEAAIRIAESLCKEEDYDLSTAKGECKRNAHMIMVAYPLQIATYMPIGIAIRDLFDYLSH